MVQLVKQNLLLIYLELNFKFTINVILVCLLLLANFAIRGYDLIRARTSMGNYLNLTFINFYLHFLNNTFSVLVFVSLVLTEYLTITKT